MQRLRVQRLTKEKKSAKSKRVRRVLRERLNSLSCQPTCHIYLAGRVTIRATKARRKISSLVTISAKNVVTENIRHRTAGERNKTLRIKFQNVWRLSKSKSDYKIH
jgi:hypothetical protein